MMIRLGDQIIDYSSDFRLILASKESGLVLPPSVASRRQLSISQLQVAVLKTEPLILL